MRRLSLGILATVAAFFAAVSLFIGPAFAVSGGISTQSQLVEGNYAVLEQNGGRVNGDAAYTLTFKYAASPQTVTAEEVYEGSRYVDGFGQNGQIWGLKSTSITKVVFDESVRGQLKPTSTAYWFEWFLNLETVQHAEYLDTSRVSDMRGMFWQCASLSSLDLSGWNVSSVTNTGRMFYSCTLLSSLNLSGWRTSSLSNMSDMFMGCSSLSELDVSGWNTSNVTDMSNAFYKCTSLTSLDISSWNTKKADRLQSMFAECYALREIRLGTGFSFKGTQESTVYQALLPEQSKNAKDRYAWHRNGESKLYTPTDLRDTYNGSSMAGLWKREVVYFVKYNANGGTGSIATQMIKAGSSVTVASGITLSRSNYSFTAWNEAANGSGRTHTAGENFTPGGSVTLYAQWKAIAPVTPDKPSDPSSPDNPQPDGGHNDHDHDHDHDEDTVVIEVDTLPMHRLYNPNSGEHFYTSSTEERDTLIGLGWNSEGIGWIAPESSSTPVHRLYNANGGEHHYTMSEDERDMLVAAGWTYEGIGWYSDDAQGRVLYREFNPNQFANNHNYTTNPDEHASLVSLGWIDEGYAWYGVGVNVAL